MDNRTSFFIDSPTYIHGRKIFVHKDYDTKAAPILAKCIWGFPDHVIGDWEGYDFTNETFDDVIKELLGVGFVQLKKAPWR